MKAIITRLGGKVNTKCVDDYEIGSIQEDEVLVKTIRVGICGTDIDVMRGFYGGMPDGSDYLVLGHECVGEIVEVGKNVNGFEIGDVVVPSLRFSDCNCNSCKVERYDLCYTGKFKEKGIDIHGFGSEYFKHKPSHLVKVDKSIKNIAVLTEPTAVAEKVYDAFIASQKRLPNPRSRNILVIGSGAIGQLTSRLFKLKGHDVTVASLEDEDSSAAKCTKSAGIGYVSIKNGYDSLKNKVFDGIMECAGTGLAIVEPLLNDILANNGTLVTTGIPNKQQNKEIDLNKLMSKIVIGNKDVVGIINQSIKPHFENAARDLPRLEAVQNIITHKYKPEECEKAFDTFLNDKNRVKVIFEFS